MVGMVCSENELESAQEWPRLTVKPKLVRERYWVSVLATYSISGGGGVIYEGVLRLTRGVGGPEEIRPNDRRLCALAPHSGLLVIFPPHFRLLMRQ